MLGPSLLGRYHRHHTHVTDPEKPNVIFSSNIPFRIGTCVTEMHLFLGGNASRLVDLAQNIGDLEVVFELNSLLQRNRQLTPFELVRRNLVFVAKGKTELLQPGAENGDAAGFSGVWKSVFAMKAAHEVFVASFRLRLDHLTIDLANPANITVSFHKDGFYELLTLCDSSIITYIGSYIRSRLFAELKNNTDISMDIANSSTILQELPVNELASLIKLMQSNGKLAFDNASFIDTTLDGMESSPILEKQLVFDDGDFDPSDDEIKVLHSDDSGKFTANDDEDDVRASVLESGVKQITLEELDIDSILHENAPPSPSKMDTGNNGGNNGASSHNTLFYAPIVKGDTKSTTSIPISKEENDRQFIADLHSLQHDEQTRTANGTSEATNRGANFKGSDVPGPLSDPSFEVEETHIDDYTPESTDDALEPCTPSKSAPMILNESSPMGPQLSLSIRSPSPEKPFDSPTRPGQRVSRQHSTPEIYVRKKSTLAFISSDDNSGLEFAFRDNSETVPSFIKKDKKFKFIKVGKVQKFVSLFEDQMDKDPGSHITSRNNTRPGSPLKRNA